MYKADQQHVQFDDSWIDRPIFSRFELIANSIPSKIAVNDGVVCLTYLNVLHAAQHLALRIESTAPLGRPVGICLPNDAHFPIAALACLATGRIYVPIDLHYPRERVDQILHEAGLAAAIVDCSSNLSYFQTVPISLLNILESLGSSGKVMARAGSVDSPAVILYTSGSTGRPREYAMISVPSRSA